MMKIKLTQNSEIANFGKPYIIAEIGANHNGDMKIAKKLIDAASECGCDAVKFQSWNPKNLWVKGTLNSELQEMADSFFLKEDQHKMMKDYCEYKQITFSSTPFTCDEADLLDELGVPFFKIASMDINNMQLLTHIASKGKPIILSTGMSTIGEIEAAIQTIEDARNTSIAILHCIAAYPPKFENINLRNISSFQKVFPYPIGLSDHSIGVGVPLASVALGSCIIEKHFTLNKSLSGWDHAVSANPTEMRLIVEESKKIVKSLGETQRKISEEENNMKEAMRRSIASNKVIKKGDKITEKDLVFKRPGKGIRINESSYVIGRIASRDIGADTLISKEDII